MPVAAALALHQAGIHTTVYERAAELREVGAGLMLWPNATRVLREFGVLDDLTARSGSSDRFLVRGLGGSVLMDIGLGHFDVPALCARRSDLLEALVSAAFILIGSKVGDLIGRRRRRSFGSGIRPGEGCVPRSRVGASRGRPA